MPSERQRERELILANTNDRLAPARVVRSHVDGCKPKLIANQAELALGPYDATGSDETPADFSENGQHSPRNDSPLQALATRSGPEPAQDLHDHVRDAGRNEQRSASEDL